MARGKKQVVLIRVGFGAALILGLAGIMALDLFARTNAATTLLFVFAVGLGLWEFYSLVERKGLRPWKITASVAGSLLVVAHWLDLRVSPDGRLLLTGSAFLAVLMVLFLSALVRRQRATALEDLGVTLLGLLYVWLLTAVSFALRNDPGLSLSDGLWVLLMMVGTSKMGDIGAFFTGSFLGRHRLAPPISPNKTIEGSVGGLAASVGFALAFSLLQPGCGALFSPVWAVVFGLSVGLVSQVGDLFESLIKRSVHAKDSGALLPEFGGILDLMDGLLFAGPAAYFLVQIIR